MDRSELLSSLRRDAAELLGAAGRDLAAPVPSCPGWTAERLVGHIGRVYRWTAGWVRAGSAPAAVEPAPAGRPVLAWAEVGLDELADALAGLDGAATAPTWLGEQPTTFWPRRMAVETALHRWDAQAATGTPVAVDAALAVVAVDELLGLLLPARGADMIAALDATGRSIHLHSTDVAGEWLVTVVPPPQALRVEHVHAKGDVAARGTASDLLLALWNRVPVDRLEVFGERELLDRWAATVRI